MLLAIDIGNTSVHLGVFKEDALISSCSLDNRVINTSQADFRELLRSAIPHHVKAAIFSSVNPKVEVFITECLEKYYSLKPQCIGKDIPVPIPVLTDHPERTGTDRLVNAVAAFERIKNWIVIIDAGTAITLDVINNKGAFLGGIIAPGIKTSSKALHHYTAFLPEVFVHKPEHVLGKNTEDAVNSGIYWGTVGMVSNLIHMLCNELKCTPTIVATGGDAKILAQEIPLIANVIPDLTLQGIRIVYKANLASLK
ncbi:MAG: type III pantothenate kinase [wastewater metagenome]|nr:type III pantothenate kinase [Candidatus Loosdrechtia aerotolerans]